LNNSTAPKTNDLTIKKLKETADTTDEKEVEVQKKKEILLRMNYSKKNKRQPCSQSKSFTLVSH